MRTLHPLRLAFWAAAAVCPLATASAQSNYSSPYFFTTLAGVSSAGSADGTGPNARFFAPTGLTVTSDGTLYVADTVNHTIRKISPAGAVTTVAGSPGRAGDTDGDAGSARFRFPTSIQAAIMSPWGFYIVDEGNHTIRRLSSSNEVSTYAGVAGEPGSVDGGSIARLREPYALSISTTNQIHFADTGNHTLRDVPALRDFLRQNPVTTLAGSAGRPGFADGVGSAVRFDTPRGVVQMGVWLYVSDAGNAVIRKGHVTGRDFAVIGTANDPRQMATDFQNIYVAERGAARIRKISESGVDSILAGSAAGEAGWVDAIGSAARFNAPEGVAADSNGNVYVGDTGNNVIRKIARDGNVTTLAGLAPAEASRSVDANGIAARFVGLANLAVSPDGSIVAVDADAHTLRKITGTGVVTTLAGQAGTAGVDDGANAFARFSAPRGVAIDSTGTIYVADTGNHTIRRIDARGGVATLAGFPGARGAIDGRATAARFNQPTAIAVDSAGVLYVADTLNHTIRKIFPDGTVTTLAGSAGVAGSTDGVGAAARFDGPSGLAADAVGNLYVAEPAQHTIRKITPDGVVTTLAGSTGRAGFADGPGAQASFNRPEALAVDNVGNLYVADSGNFLLRKIARDGDVSTIAGLLNAPGSADGIGEAARFLRTAGITVDNRGTLYVSNGTALRHGLAATSPTIVNQPQSQTVVRGASVTLSVTVSAVPDPAFQWYFNGVAIANATSSSYSLGNVQVTEAGDYTVVVTNSLGSVTSAKATLAISAPPSGNTTPAAPGSGGGAPSAPFLVVAALAAGLRIVRRRER